MIIISNSQRDQILRYLDMFCDSLPGDDLRSFNTRRLARNLAKRLRAKESVSAAELRNIKKQ